MSSCWFLVSKPRRNHKSKCIWVIIKPLSQASKLEYYHIYIHRLITTDEMKRLTSSEDCYELKVDSLYLPWTMSKWTTVGEIREYEIDQTELCSNMNNLVHTFFPSKNQYINIWKLPYRPCQPFPNFLV